MPSIAPLTEVSRNVDTVAKFVRVITKEGVTMEQLSLPINSRSARRNLAAFIAAGCPKIALSNKKGSVCAGEQPSQDVMKDHSSKEGGSRGSYVRVSDLVAGHLSVLLGQ